MKGSPLKHEVRQYIYISAINVLRTLLRLISVTFQFYTPSCTLRSASDTLSLQIPRTRLSTVGSRAFSVFGPCIWSDLPLPLRQKPSLDSINSNLKTFLFPKTIDLPCFPFRAAVVLRSKSYFAVCLSCV